MFCGEFNGWYCGTCNVPITAGDFFGVKAFPVVYDEYVPIRNPFVPILDARNYLSTSNLDPSYRWDHKVLKLRGNVANIEMPSSVSATDLSPYVSNSFEASILPRTQPQECVFHSVQSSWDQLEFDPDDPNNPNPNPSGINNVRHHSPVRPLGTIAKRIDGVQSYVYVLSKGGTVQEGTDNEPPQRYAFIDKLEGRFLPEWQLDIIDLSNQSLVSNQNIIFGFGSAFVSNSIVEPSYVPIAGKFYNFLWAARKNLVVSGNSLIVSTYAAYGSIMNRWAVARIPMSGQGGTGAACAPASQVSGQDNIVCGSFSADELSTDATSRNYVITYDLNSTWKLGIWDSSTLVGGPPVPGEPFNPTTTAYLEPSEVTSTITSGQLSPNEHILLCYNRIQDRDLAIWFDWGSQTKPLTDPDTPPEPGPGYFESLNVTGWREIATWVYDSSRPTNQFYRYKRITFWITPNGNPDEVPTGCSGFVTDRVTQYDWLHNYALPFSSDRPNGDYGPPTFITADKNGDIYMGSPQFVSKFTGVAGEFGDETWTIHAKEEYPTIERTITTNCSIDSNQVRTLYLPFSKLSSSSGDSYDFGRIDYRNFSILIDDDKIQLRGFEGLIDNAVLPPELIAAEGIDIEDWRTRYADYPTRSMAAGAERIVTSWITDWTITGDGKYRIPHLEPMKTELGFALGPDDLSTTELIPDAATANAEPGPPFPPFLPSQEALGYWDYRESNYWDEFFPTFDRDTGRPYHEIVEWSLGPRAYSDRPLADWVCHQAAASQFNFSATILPVWTNGYGYASPSPAYSELASFYTRWGVDTDLQNYAKLFPFIENLRRGGLHDYGVDLNSGASGIERDAIPPAGSINTQIVEISHYLGDSIWFNRDTAYNSNPTNARLNQASAGLSCAWWDVAE